MGENNSIIRFDNVTMSYEDEDALVNFSLEIEKGEFLTVIGTSGCGKTTMLKLINGLLKPKQGYVQVNDEYICNTDLIKLRRNIGYVVQEIGLFPHMNIEKNIAYVLNLDKKVEKAKKHKKVLQMMEVIGLEPELLKRHPSELSGGQRQRIGIARALISEPDIMLMDEPFGAVDEITRKKLQEEIQSIHKQLGVTIIFVTHDIKEAMKLGTRVLVMDGGKIIQYDTPEAITERPNTEFVRQLVCR